MATDDTTLVERLRGEIAFVQGDAAAWGVDTYGDLPRNLQLLADAADAISRLEAERDRARQALTAISSVINGAVRDNGDKKYTLHLGGERYEGPAVEFLGYALTSIDTLARNALEPVP